MCSSNRKLVSTLALLSTLWAVLATSQSQDGPYQGKKLITSDCVKPVIEEEIQFNSDHTIKEPVGRTFLDYGFPEDHLPYGVKNAGLVNGLWRECEKVYGEIDTDDSEWVFNCYDAGKLACTVLVD